MNTETTHFRLLPLIQIAIFSKRHKRKQGSPMIESIDTGYIIALAGCSVVILINRAVFFP